MHCLWMIWKLVVHLQNRKTTELKVDPRESEKNKQQSKFADLTTISFVMLVMFIGLGTYDSGINIFSSRWIPNQMAFQIQFSHSIDFVQCQPSLFPLHLKRNVSEAFRCGHHSKIRLWLGMNNDFGFKKKQLRVLA